MFPSLRTLSLGNGSCLFTFSPCHLLPRSGVEGTRRPGKRTAAGEKGRVTQGLLPVGSTHALYRSIFDIFHVLDSPNCSCVIPHEIRFKHLFRPRGQLQDQMNHKVRSFCPDNPKGQCVIPGCPMWK